MTLLKSSNKCDTISCLIGSSLINDAASLNALDDFKLLSQSKNLYLSNSTFSFWAACCSLMLNDSNIFYNNDFEFANLLIKDNLIRSYK